MSETYIPAALRQQVFDRAHGCCEYCRIGEADRALNYAIDHIIAEKHGGQTIPENLCLSCFWCNSYKGSDISSVDWVGGQQIIALFNPRKHRWDEHFRLKRPSLNPLHPSVA